VTQPQPKAHASLRVHRFEALVAGRNSNVQIFAAHRETFANGNFANPSDFQIFLRQAFDEAAQSLAKVIPNASEGVHQRPDWGRGQLPLPCGHRCPLLAVSHHGQNALVRTGGLPLRVGKARRMNGGDTFTIRTAAR